MNEIYTDLLKALAAAGYENTKLRNGQGGALIDVVCTPGDIAEENGRIALDRCIADAGLVHDGCILNRGSVLAVNVRRPDVAAETPPADAAPEAEHPNKTVALPPPEPED